MARARDSKIAKAFDRLVTGTDRESEKVLYDLREGRKKIRKNWAQGSLAVDEDGEKVSPNSEQAVGWCALGAVGVKDESKLNAAGRALEICLDPEILEMGESVPYFNDDVAGDAEDVVKLFNKAIKYVEQHGVPTKADVKRRVREIQSQSREDG